eukprot:2570844-Karenia_brevis.AAC.1
MLTILGFALEKSAWFLTWEACLLYFNFAKLFIVFCCIGTAVKVVISVCYTAHQVALMSATVAAESTALGIGSRLAMSVTKYIWGQPAQPTYVGRD